MEIKIYNSLTNRLETFKPLVEKKLSMYVCGPTVYNYIHIGNARPVVFFDLIHRFFKYIGYQVTYVSNFTDIDDKIIKKAKETKTTEKQVAQKYIDAFLENWKYLNCLDASMHPLVTENMPSIINFITALKEHGFAYQVADDVYFRVKKAHEYGILSNQVLEDLEVGARIDNHELKEDPRDFVLWKLTNDEGLKWDSPFGIGRPGWHTECCVMIDKIFNGMIDIHGGGIDLKFPHHENEIAQSNALFHHKIANYWVHNGRVDINNEKMSKSLGNIVWVKDLAEKVPGSAIRLLLLNTSYRQLINYTEELLNQSITEWNKIERAFISLERYVTLNDLSGGQLLDEMSAFIKALCHDFTVTSALTCLMSVVKQANIALRLMDETMVSNCYKTLVDMFEILGFQADFKPLTETEKALVRRWQLCRKNKDFEQADILKKQIDSEGIKL